MSSTPDWFGLLKWSLSHNDGTTNSDAKVMSKEEADWLERVMREAVKDEPTRMKEIMVYLTKIVDSGVDSDEDKTIDQLEELRDIVEGIDMAEVFTKFGGVQCLIPIVTGDFPIVLQSMCCSVIATIAQNNPKVQESLCTQGTIGKLVRIFIATESIQLASKVLYAVSCIVRGNPEAEEEISPVYTEVIVPKAMTSGEPSFINRTFFLGSALICSDTALPSSKKKIITSLFPHILDAMNGKLFEVKESALMLLEVIMQQQPKLFSSFDRSLYNQALDIVADEAQQREEAQMLPIIESIKNFNAEAETVDYQVNGDTTIAATTLQAEGVNEIAEVDTALAFEQMPLMITGGNPTQQN